MWKKKNSFILLEGLVALLIVTGLIGLEVWRIEQFQIQRNRLEKEQAIAQERHHKERIKWQENYQKGRHLP